MYAFCQDMPGISAEDQAKLNLMLPVEALNGCIVHVVGPMDGGTRMIDVGRARRTTAPSRSATCTQRSPSCSKTIRCRTPGALPSSRSSR